MSKHAIKARIIPEQNGLCALSGAELPEDLSLVDTDRILERARDAGTYADENTRIVTPRAHMARHGILREREDWLDHLKTLMDDRNQLMKLQMKINNQLLAYQRHTDTPHQDTVDFMTAQLEPIKKKLGQKDREVTKHLKGATDPLVHAALGVPGVGPITVAGLLTYVDLNKANSASALWKYVGLHCASGDRYIKGEAGGGNKTLRTLLYNTACAMMKNRDCAYRIVYDRTKARLEVSEKIVQSRNNQGKLVEVPWKDTMASHRHGAALRAIIKHFLADYWFVGRTLAGLPARPLYVEEKLGHTGIARPEERGWAF